MRGLHDHGVPLKAPDKRPQLLKLLRRHEVDLVEDER